MNIITKNILLFLTLLTPVFSKEEGTSEKNNRPVQISLNLSEDFHVSIYPFQNKLETDFLKKIINFSEKEIKIDSYGNMSGIRYLYPSEFSAYLFTFENININEIKKICSIKEYNSFRKKIPLHFWHETSEFGLVCNAWHWFYIDKEENWVFYKMLSFIYPKAHEKGEELLSIYVLKEVKKSNEIPDKIKLFLLNHVPTTDSVATNLEDMYRVLGTLKTISKEKDSSIKNKKMVSVTFLNIKDEDKISASKGDKKKILKLLRDNGKIIVVLFHDSSLSGKSEYYYFNAMTGELIANFSGK